MKLVKTASGKQTIKMSKKEWASIGKKAGWGLGSTPEDWEKDERYKEEKAFERTLEENGKTKAQDGGTIKENLKSIQGVMDMARYFLKMNIDDLADFISALENANQYIELTMRANHMLGLAKEQLEFRQTQGNEEPYKI